jgi:hypothetical protein
MGDGHANMQFPLSPGRDCSLSSTATCSPWGGTQRTYESHFRRPRRRNDGPVNNGGRSCKYAIPPVPGERLQLILHRHLLPVRRDVAHL